MTLKFRNNKLAGIILMLALWCNCASAECNIKLEMDNIEWRGGTRAGYGIFDSSEYPQTIQFKVRLINGEPSPFFIAFGDIGEADSHRASNGNDSLDYQLYDSLNRKMTLKGILSANVGEVLNGAFNPGETVKDISYVIVVPSQQIKPPGQYTGVLRIVLYSGTPDNFIQQDSKTITFSIMVDKVAELSLVKTGSGFDPNGKSQGMDFGSLTKGKTKGFDLRIRSNVGYHVTLESENGGVLKNIDPQYNDTIPYVLTTDGIPVGLSGGRQSPIIRNSRLTDQNGDRDEIAVTIGDTSKATAGTYRDQVLITVVSDN